MEFQFSSLKSGVVVHWKGEALFQDRNNNAINRIQFFTHLLPGLDRKSVVSGKSVSVRVVLGGRRIINKRRQSTQSSPVHKISKVSIPTSSNTYITILSTRT